MSSKPFDPKDAQLSINGQPIEGVEDAEINFPEDEVLYHPDTMFFYTARGKVEVNYVNVHRIISWYSHGWSKRKISKHLGIPRIWVSNVIKLFEAEHSE